MNSLTNEALDKYIRYFTSNLAYGMLEQQQIARASIKLVEVEVIKKKDIIKDKTFEQIGQSIYLRIPLKFLIAGERIIQRNIRSIRYQLLTLTEIVKHFGNTVDIFVDGIKVPHTEIRIALYDDFFIAELPRKYDNYTDINAVVRSYVLDKLNNNGTITIPKSSLNAINSDSFILYTDGIQCSNYSINETNGNIVIRTPVNARHYELTYMRHLNKIDNIRLINNHINIKGVNRKFPIAASNIITYLNGKFINLELVAKTNEIFKANNPINGTFTLYYFYHEYDFEDIKYDDAYAWFSRYNSNFMDIVNNPNLLPDYMNNHKLFRTEISLSDFVKNRYTNINEYNKDRALDTISYNEECFVTLLDFMYKEYINNNSISTTSNNYDMNVLGKSNWVRTTNRNDLSNPNNYTDFKTEMVLIVVPNIDKSPLSILIDGIKIYDNYISYWESDVTYVYINSNLIENDSFIEVEKVKVNHSDMVSTIILGNGTNKINISNCKELGIYKNNIDLNFFVLAEKQGSRFIYENIIKDISYNEDTDILTLILSTNSKLNVSYKLYNSNFTRSWQTNTRIENTGYEIVLKGAESSIIDRNNLRCFKNGKEIPRKFWELLLPSRTNNLSDPVVNLDISYGVYEHIDVTYTPTKYIETTFIRSLKRDGLVDLLNTANHENEYISEYGYYTLNGQRVTPNKYKKWCSKGLSLNGLKSVDYFTIVYRDNGILMNDMRIYLDKYKNHAKELNQYILSLMHGALDNSNNIGSDDIIPPINEPDPSRAGKVYYDLYNEFLKHNIINAEAKLPDYIILKYGGLINQDTQVIKLDANITQYKWMPLDANTVNTNMENIRHIMGLYYQLLDNWEYIFSIPRDEIPDDIYEQYKDLFDNNVLVLQLPDTSSLI